VACGARFSADAIAVAAALIVSKALFKALESPFAPLISASLNQKKPDVFTESRRFSFTSRIFSAKFSRENFGTLDS
jgi:hypothetical protein